MVVNGSERRRRKVQQKTVDHELVVNSTAPGESGIGIIAAVPAAGHIAETEGVVACLDQCAQVHHLSRRAPSVSPEPRRAKYEHAKGVNKDCGGRQYHCEIRHHAVESALSDVYAEQGGETLAQNDQS